MKKDLMIIKIIFILMLVIFCTACSRDRKNKPRAEDGVLDLSEWDFSQDGPVRLKGEWDFYWQKLVYPSDVEIGKGPEKDGVIEIPGIWNQQKLDGSCLGKYGTITYRLRILPPRGRSSDLSLYFHDINTAYRLFVNGKLLTSCGVVGLSKETSVPEVRPVMIDFSPGNQDNLDIVIQVSNYHHRFGGIRSHIILGSKADMAKQRDINLFSDFFFFGGILIFAFSSAGLYIFRRKDVSPLFFSLSCLFIAMRTLLVGEVFILHFFPSLNWELLMKLDYLSFYMVVPIFNILIFSLFPSHLYKRVLIVLIVLQSGGCLLVAFTKAALFSSILPFFQLVTFANSLYVLYVLIDSFFKKREGAILIFSGCIVFFLTIINDFLFANDIIHTGYYSSGGLFIFILSQAYYISLRQARAFTTAEHLSENLQNEVVKQTGRLIVEAQNALDSKKEVEKMIKQKTNFFLNITHETKTPVTLIMNYLELYIKKHGTDPDLDIAFRNARMLERNMNNYMQIEKAAESEEKLYRHETICDLSALIVSICAPYPAEIIELDLESKVLIKANPDAVKRVLDNLLINALKYNDLSVRVIISLRQKADMIELSVSDNGVGIPQDQIENIFNPFYQLSNPKKNIQGIGLGLSMVKTIIDSLEGEVAIKSAPGEGAAFCIVLKAYSGSEYPAGKVISQISEASPVVIEQPPLISDSTYVPSKESLLIVEDTIDTLALLKKSLQDEFNIFVAQNGRFALDKLEQLHQNKRLPRLIISDVMMDEVNGYQFVAALREDERFMYIPVIFLTAKAESDGQLQGFSSGAVTYMTKPFSMDTLKAAVRSNIESREALLDDYELSRFNEEGFFNKCNELGLTQAQREILKLWLVDNLSQKKVAETLNKSQRMVEKHIKQIKKNIGLTDDGYAKPALIRIFKDFIH